MRVPETVGSWRWVVVLGWAGCVVLGLCPKARAATAKVHFPEAPRPGGLHPARRPLLKSPGPLASQLGRLRSEAIVLQAELAIAKLRREILKVRNEGCDGADPPSASGIAPERTGERDGALLFLPEIDSIEGLGGVLHAVVRYPDGARETVGVGTVLEDGLKVVRVDVDGVVVAGAGEVRVLPFSAASGAEGGVSISPYIRTPTLPVLPAADRHTARVPGGGPG